MEGYFWWSQMGKGYVLAFSGHKPEVLNVLQCLGKFHATQIALPKVPAPS